MKTLMQSAKEISENSGANIKKVYARLFGAYKRGAIKCEKVDDILYAQQDSLDNYLAACSTRRPYRSRKATTVPIDPRSTDAIINGLDPLVKSMLVKAAHKNNTTIYKVISKFVNEAILAKLEEVDIL